MPHQRKSLLSKPLLSQQLKELRKRVLNLQRGSIPIETEVIRNFTQRRPKLDPVYFNTLPKSSVTYPDDSLSETLIRIPTIHLFEFLVGSTTTQPGQLSSLLQYRNNEWSAISAPNLRDEFGLGVFTSRIRSIETNNNIIWLLNDSGFDDKYYRSINAGETWEQVIGPEGFQKYLQYDASGRLWLLVEGDDGVDFVARLYRDDTGVGDNFNLIYTAEPSYISDSSWWGPKLALACHPTNPDIVAFIYADTTVSEQHVAITTDGENFNTQVLAGFDPAHEFQIAFATGEIRFSSTGRLFIAHEVEHYVAPHEHIYFVDYSDDYETFVSVQPLGLGPPSFGFVTNLVISADGQKVFNTFVHDFNDEGGFDGLRTYLMYSNNGGESYVELCRFDQPANELDDMPGYPSGGLWYDEINQEVWIFFTPFAFTSDILAISNTLQQRVDLSGNKNTDLNSFFANLTGLTAPHGVYTGVIA